MEDNVKMIVIADNMLMDYGLKQETQYEVLNRSGFVRTPEDEDVAQWILLVNDALDSIGFLKEEYLPVRDYLVRTLRRFIDEGKLLSSLNGYAYWQRALTPEGMSVPMVRQIADIGLLYITIFREYSEYRHNPKSIRYAATQSEQMYEYLASEPRGFKDIESSWLESMKEHFGLAIMALDAIVKMSGRSVVRDQFYEGIRFPTDTEAQSDRKDADEFQLLFGTGDESGSSTIM